MAAEREYQVGWGSYVNETTDEHDYQVGWGQYINEDTASTPAGQDGIQIFIVT